jgi:Phage integrase family
MKSLKQNGTSRRKKSGQEVAKSNFGKTDTRYWHEVIFKPSYTEHGRKRYLETWAARMQWRGRRELFNLNTSNKAAAASKAKDIYATLVGAGWDAALEKFKPEMKRKALLTVGDFIKELRGHWSGKPKTFEDYCQKFRSIVSQIFAIKGGKEKFDYVSGGRDAWIAKIGNVKLADVTPDKINKWRIAFVKKAGGNPLEQRRARISCNSIIRQAKSLFAPDLLAHVALHMPDKLPFDGVAFYERESMRYHSTVDIEALIADAMKELKQEPLKIFLLATMAGLRRNEIDTLQWSAFRWNDAVIRIEMTEHFTPKTTDSGGDVPIDKELVALFRGWHAKATGSFVIESNREPQAALTYTAYRAQEHFDRLVAWLRVKGVTAIKPLHELRKEFGSQVCAKYGIYAASRMLRHADIAITAQHYLDQKERVTFGMGNLLGVPANVTPMPVDKPSYPSGAPRKGKKAGK